MTYIAIPVLLWIGYELSLMGERLLRIALALEKLNEELPE